MICYLDRTFCISPQCKCSRKLTEAIKEDAERWWREGGGAGEPPIAVDYFCGGEPKEEPVDDPR